MFLPDPNRIESERNKLESNPATIQFRYRNYIAQRPLVAWVLPTSLLL